MLSSTTGPWRSKLRDVLDQFGKMGNAKGGPDPANPRAIVDGQGVLRPLLKSANGQEHHDW